MHYLLDADALFVGIAGRDSLIPASSTSSSPKGEPTTVSIVTKGPVSLPASTLNVGEMLVLTPEGVLFWTQIGPAPSIADRTEPAPYAVVGFATSSDTLQVIGNIYE